MKTGFVARGNQNHNWVCQVASHLAQKGPSMNKFLIISFGAVITVVVAAQAAPPSDLIARIHFAGAEHISADTNSAALTNFFCSAEAQALREQTLNKLSHFPYTWFKSRLAAGASNGAEQLRPLLDDLLKSEWFLEIRDTTNGAPETALAIRLNSGRDGAVEQKSRGSFAGLDRHWDFTRPAWNLVAEEASSAEFVSIQPFRRLGRD